jgi:hypothetical protein
VGVTFLLVVGVFVAIFAACSNQGEGERCEILNGNDDCKDGLICTSENLLRNANSDRCCPSDRSKATHPICKTASEIGLDGSTAPADTGPPPSADAGSDADADASNVGDAGADADAEAGQ